MPGAQRAPNPRSRPLAAHCTRRSLLLMPMLASPLTAHAAGKLVVDSSSRFALTIPSGFVASKRSATQGTLYVAGNFPRAAVVSVTAWPVGELLAADAAALSLPGMPAVTPNTEALSAKSLSEIAPTEELARILARQRDREQGGALNSEVLRCSLENGRLTVELSTELPVTHALTARLAQHVPAKSVKFPTRLLLGVGLMPDVWARIFPSFNRRSPTLMSLRNSEAYVN